MSIIDFYNGLTFDPGSTSNSSNFLNVFSGSKPFSVVFNASDRWVVQTDFVFGGVGYIGFFPLTVFVPGPTSTRTAPAGVVDAVVLYDSGGAVIAVFDNLGGLGRSTQDFINDPSLLVSGSDDFLGSASTDIFHAGASGDIVSGAGGADQLYGDAGNDVMSGGDGNDFLNGGDDLDLLLGDAGNDTLNGGNGDDALAGGLGDDILNGDAGVDLVSYVDVAAGVTVSLAVAGAQNTGGGGIDTLTGIERLEGSDLNDTLTGGASGDKLYGAGGADNVHGGGGADSIEGGAGDDVLDGDAGNDTLLGGLGSDSYGVDA
ncbi:MAG: hypothetical protein FD124_1098, partial [Alphaproteobacteria bacterium]